MSFIYYIDSSLSTQLTNSIGFSGQYSNGYTNPTSLTHNSVSSSSWSIMPQLNETNSCFLHTTNCDHEDSECDQANHLWFCLQDYSCLKMEDFMHKLHDYIQFRNNRSELIMVHTLHPVFEYKDVLSETRNILAMFLNKSNCGKSLDEIIGNHMPAVAREHIENLITKFLNVS